LEEHKYIGQVDILWSQQIRSLNVFMNGIMDIDTNYYDIVTIDAGGVTKTWMAENMRTTRDSEGKPVTNFIYDNDPLNLEMYGRLYMWEDLMNGSTEPGSQGICPDGWHVPDSIEFSHLWDNFTTEELVIEGSSGFDGLFGGRWATGGWDDIGSLGLWYTSNLVEGDGLIYWISGDLMTKGKTYYPIGQGATSLRCVKDSTMVR
jgi:uncharacterized protein (TIGR02145 family)